MPAICCQKPAVMDSRLGYSGRRNDPPVDARIKLIYERTKTATTNLRPCTESSWQGKATSTWSMYFLCEPFLTFSNQLSRQCPNKKDQREPNSPC